MKNKLIKITTIILTIILFCMNILSVYAAEVEPEPEDPIEETPYENCDYCNCDFLISSSGEATVYVNYRGNPNTFTHIRSTIKIQKQLFWFIWTDVEVNQYNKWVDDYSSLQNTISHSYNLTSTGNYRAVFDIEVYGTSGVTDTINDTIEKSY